MAQLHPISLGDLGVWPTATLSHLIYQAAPLTEPNLSKPLNETNSVLTRQTARSLGLGRFTKSLWLIYKEIYKKTSYLFLR